MVLIDSHSFIRHAVTISTPARAESGIVDIIGANINIESKRTTECVRLVSLVWQPDLIATLVLAMAAVAGTPPKNGIIILPIPCATSSMPEFNFSFFILPALAPQSKLSIIPSAAIDIAGDVRLPTEFKLIEEKFSLSERKMDFGISPTAGTLNLNIPFATVTRTMARSEDGQYFASFWGYRNINSITERPITRAVMLICCEYVK
ncbi:hypothetical protein SDC9_88857 [bioreactor metagenome]|uniref:Uncharacterized protein n=1 Tax=bioreactor metagenome TaxID=1076179 RepID=A0A644ZX94_9ZZZZ